MFKRFIFLLVTLSVFISACSGQPAGNGTSETTDAYDYPVRPGSSGWAAFTTHTEMLEACQIPEAILENMSTAGLVETVLNYPLAIDMWAFNDIQTGFEAISLNFNGIQELFTREDAETALLFKYCSLNISTVSEDWEPANRAEYTLGTIAFMEVILAQEDVIADMAEGARLDLLREALEKSNEKKQCSGLYGPADQIYTVWIIGRVLNQEEYTPFMEKLEGSTMLQRFISVGSMTCGTDLLDEVISIAQEFLAQI